MSLVRAEKNTASDSLLNGSLGIRDLIVLTYMSKMIGALRALSTFSMKYRTNIGTGFDSSACSKSMGTRQVIRAMNGT